MEIILFLITLTCVVVIAFNLYVLELNAAINLEAIIAVLDMFFAIAMAFVYFYISEWITMDLMKIGDNLYNSPWYCVLAVEQQKLLVLSIQQAQRERRLRGLGLFDGSLVVFASVIAREMCTLIQVSGMDIERDFLGPF